jgi:flagellar motility protein MotE (MotC chaperone)
MVQLGQASSDTKTKVPKPPTPSIKQVAAQPTDDPGVPVADPENDGKPLTPPSTAAQGPALDTPREVIEMLDLRKRDLDRREEAVRQNEERFMMVRVEIEKLLAKNEALEKRIQNARGKQDQQATEEKTTQAKVLLDKERQAQEQKSQLAKMYESMPPEEAAARLERMPDRKAVEILRMVKGKTAGTILAQVKAERAAKFTEQLLAQNP